MSGGGEMKAVTTVVFDLEDGRRAIAIVVQKARFGTKGQKKYKAEQVAFHRAMEVAPEVEYWKHLGTYEFDAKHMMVGYEEFAVEEVR
jgi:hypothetical protein